MLDDGNFRCDACKEIIPDAMLWIEVVGTYKDGSKYTTFRWDLCDLHCLKSHLDNLDLSKIAIAKHKIKKKGSK